MILGGYTFADLPHEIPQVVQKGIDVSAAKTIDGVATFVWPATYKGEVVNLRWEYMTTAQYASILALYLAGDSLTFNPEDSTGRTFTVLISDFYGAYHMNLADAVGTYRQNVDLTLVIIAEQ